MAQDLWPSFGFKGNPYQATPLRPTAADYELFIGREDTGIEFRTQIESDTGCVTVISGDVGVGKTSFFNIQQFLLFSGKADFGPRLVPALELTPLHGEDTPTLLARRIAHNAVKSMEMFCQGTKHRLPKQVGKIKKWLSHKGSAAGFDVGLSILGSGGNVAMSFDAPPVSEASLENWGDILHVIASEAVETLGYDGIFVVLDNAENVDNDKLTELLMAYRDTLFTTEGIWWVVIGQSGLYSLIDAADKRISQRIQGTGLEVSPLTSEELHAAVERRVQTFRAKTTAKSPISREIHDKLYEASRGEIRFVLKTSDALVRKAAAAMRVEAAELVKKTSLSGSARKKLATMFSDVLTKRLIDGELPDAAVENSLRDLSYEQMQSLRLKRKELQVLRQIGSGEARASDHEQFRIKTMQDFSSNYLTKLFSNGLLHRRQAGRAVYYSLRGFASLSHEFGLFDRLIAES